MCTSQTISLLSFGNPPFSPPWTVDFNMGSILPTSGGAVGKSQDLGFGLSFLFISAFCILLFLLEAVSRNMPWNTVVLWRNQLWWDTDLGPFCCPLWVFPGTKLRTEPSLKLFFPWTKAAKLLAHGNLSTSASHSLYPHCWKSQLFSQCEGNFFLFFLLCSILE